MTQRTLTGEQWEMVEKERRGHHSSWTELGARLGMTAEEVRLAYVATTRAQGTGQAQVVAPSPYPVYDSPLRMTGDALVIADPEFPFHHAEFLNRVLGLASAWGVRQCIIAGDVLHFDSISAWAAAWRQPSSGGLSDEQERAFLDFVTTLPANAQEAGIALLDQIGKQEPGDGVSEELAIARRELGRLGEMFDRVDYVIGNHDDRLLRSLNSPMFASELLALLQLPEPKWRIAPFYFSFLESGGEVYRIEHPNTTARSAASKLASKYLCHVVMAHDHAQIVERDASGTFWAIHAGHVVDERRLAYAAQRSTARPAHNLGAVLVRDGFPYVLNEQTPWERYMRMV